MTLTLSKLRKYFRQALETENKYPDDEFYMIWVTRGIQELSRRTKKIKEVKFKKLKKKDIRANYKLTVKKGSLPIEPKEL